MVALESEYRRNISTSAAVAAGDGRLINHFAARADKAADERQMFTRGVAILSN